MSSTGSFSKLSWLKRTNGHKFTLAEMRVLMSIYNHSGADGTRSFPGLDVIMDEACLKKTATSDAIRSLKSRGWVREMYRGSGRSGKKSEFALVPDAPNSSNPEPWRKNINTPASAGQLNTPAGAGQFDGNTPASADGIPPRTRYPSDPVSDPLGSDHKKVRPSANQGDTSSEPGGSSPISRCKALGMSTADMKKLALWINSPPKVVMSAHEVFAEKFGLTWFYPPEGGPMRMRVADPDGDEESMARWTVAIAYGKTIGVGTAPPIVDW